ncbi:MAG: GNAT family N-acetyltransferase [Sphingomonadaceae bacterium]|nr:GNAT family N-acetyltransferase [Sphingomonadaceae bacterium]
MPSPSLRPAAAADLPALHALIERAYRGDRARAGWTHEADLLGGQRTDQAALTGMLADPLQRLYVAEVDGALVGCVSLLRKPGGVAYLGLLTVDPKRQAGGLGRAVLAAAEERAVADLGATRVEMTVIRQRAELIAWYERRGYAPTGEERAFPYGDKRFGIPAVPDLAFVVLDKRVG